MPEIARFHGIVIRMYSELGGTHHRPHFHAYCQDDVCVFAVDKVEAIAGSLPLRSHRLTLAWAELHRGELLANWTRLQAGRRPFKIEPLR